MSNPPTNYITYNPISQSYQDLSQIFLPLSLGTKYPTPTGFNVNGSDLNTIFAANNGTTTIPYNTNYIANNGQDLKNIFAPYNPINVTNNTGTLSYVTYNNVNYTVLTLSGGKSANFIQNAQHNVQINFILVGSGAGGGAGNGSTGGGGSGGGGGGGGGFIQGTFQTASGVTYTTVGAAATGIGGKYGSGSNGSNGSSSYIQINNTYYIYAFGGLNQNISTGYSNGGNSGNHLNGGYGGGYGITMPNSSITIAGNYQHNLNSTDYTNSLTNPPGAAGGCGADGNGYGGGSNNSLPTANSPVTNIGSLGSGYTMTYLGKVLYVSGGGSGCFNNKYKDQGGQGNPPGGAPSGGYGGNFGSGGDGYSGFGPPSNITPAFGGGGGGGSWGSSTGAGGTGAAGCAILWWVTYQ